jgi:HSP20 family protein
MNMRDLIPWGRQSGTAPVQYQDQDNPVVGVRREMNRLFDDLFRGSLPGLGSGLGLGRALAPWPHVELSEADGEIRIAAEVPGMSEQDIELLMEDGVLAIRGEKKSESLDQERGYSELHYGRFERRISLPANVDEGGVRASFRDGVLTVTLPKSAEAERGRRIPINRETRH